MDNPPKRHHYLPQSYLRAFAREEVIWVFDRARKEIRAQKVIDTAVKKHFYSVESEDGTRNTAIETALAKIDGVIPGLIRSLRAREVLDGGARVELCFVAALMMNRTPDFHEGIARVEGEIIKRVSGMMFRSVEDAAASIERWKQEDQDAKDMDPKELFEFFQEGNFNVKIHRNRSLEVMLKLTAGLAPSMCRLNVGVLHPPKGAAFITTDRPFVVTPPRDTSWMPRWAGVGVFTPGAQKFLPVASDLAVVFGDPGGEFLHIDLRRDHMKGVNAAVGNMTDRFLLGRDRALVEWWAKRLGLSRREKVRVMDIV